MADLECLDGSCRPPARAAAAPSGSPSGPVTPTAGALRAVVDVRPRFSSGGWRTGATLRLEAWGAAGTGVLAELDEGAVGALLAGLLGEVAALHDAARQPLPRQAAPRVPATAGRG